MAAKQLSGATASDCQPTAGSMTLGAAGMDACFGSWRYGIFDAADAAHRFNAARRLVAGVEPVVAPAGGGRTRLGSVLTVGR